MGATTGQATSQASMEDAVLSAVRVARASVPTPPGADRQHRFAVTAIEVAVGGLAGTLWTAEVELLGGETT